MVVYKPSRTHVAANALSKLSNTMKPTTVFDETTDASMFYTKFEWLNDVKDFLRIGQIKGTLFIQQK
jgi:hypothetical protein